MNYKNKKRKKLKKIDSEIYGEEFIIEENEIDEEKKEGNEENDLKEEDIDEIYK